MTFKVGSSGNKKGRPKGIPDKRLDFHQVKEILNKKGCNPFEIMADMSMNERLEDGIRFQAAKELAQYIAPKLKGVTIDLGEDGRKALKQIINI